MKRNGAIMYTWSTPVVILNSFVSQSDGMTTILVAFRWNTIENKNHSDFCIGRIPFSLVVLILMHSYHYWKCFCQRDSFFQFYLSFFYTYLQLLQLLLSMPQLTFFYQQLIFNNFNFICNKFSLFCFMTDLYLLCTLLIFVL